MPCLSPVLTDFPEISRKFEGLRLELVSRNLALHVVQQKSGPKPTYHGKFTSYGAIRPSGVISGLGVYVSDVWATPCSHVGQLKTCLAVVPVDPSGVGIKGWDARMRSITQASKEKQQTKGGEASNACLQASKLMELN